MNRPLHIIALAATSLAPLALIACAHGESTPAPVVVPSASPPSSAPTAATTTAPTPTETTAPTPTTAPSAPQFPDSYADCKQIRPTASVPSPADLTAARAGDWVWPPVCGQVQGWAGMGITSSTHATAFSGDGKKFLVCGTSSSEACHVFDLQKGKVSERIVDAYPRSVGLAGQPVTDQAPVKALLRRLHAPGPAHAFPYSGDLRVSWRVAPEGHALELTFLALATGTERVVARLPGASTDSEQPVVLQGVTLSPDGAMLEAHVFEAQGGAGTLFQVALVNVHAEAAPLLRDLAAHAQDAAEKTRLEAAAKQAEARGRSFAPTFVDG